MKLFNTKCELMFISNLVGGGEQRPVFDFFLKSNILYLKSYILSYTCQSLLVGLYDKSPLEHLIIFILKNIFDNRLKLT